MQLKPSIFLAICLSLSFAPLFAASLAGGENDTLVPPAPILAVPPVRAPEGYDNATIRVKLEIDAQGLPHHIDTLELLPTEARELVISAVKRWKFRPATLRGLPVNVWVILPVKFAVGV